MRGCQPPSYRTGAERVSEKNSSRKLAEQARCATLPSATRCGPAHRCELTPQAYLRTTRVCAAMSPRRCRLAVAITAMKPTK